MIIYTLRAVYGINTFQRTVFNPSSTKHYSLYLKTHIVPRSKHCLGYKNEVTVRQVLLLIARFSPDSVILSLSITNKYFVHLTPMLSSLSKWYRRQIKR